MLLIYAETNKPITPIDFGITDFLLTKPMRFVMQLEFLSNNGHAGITLDRVRQQVRRKVFVRYRHSPRYARMPYVVMPVLTRETLSAGDGVGKITVNIKGFEVKNIKEISMCLIIVVLMFSEGGYAGKRNGFLIDVDSRLITINPGNSFDLMVSSKFYGNWQSPLNIDIPGLPEGIEVYFNNTANSKPILTKNKKSLPFRISTDKLLPAGSYRFYIVATSESEEEGQMVIGVPIQLYVFNKNKERTVIPVSVKDEKIRGVVYDDRNNNDSIDSGEPVSGAIVRIAGTEITANTDIAGYFFIVDPHKKRKINEVQLEVTLK